jgi:hypothetical protein
VPLRLQAAGEKVDDEFCPAVCRRGDWHPGGAMIAMRIEAVSVTRRYAH